MGVIVPNGEAQAVVVLQLAGAPKQATWTLGLKPSAVSPPDPPLTAAGLASLMRSGLEDAPNGLYRATAISTAYTYVGVQVSLATPSGPIVAFDSAGIVGTAASSPMPKNCALLLTKFTALGGRRNKGRSYLPPTLPDEAAVDPNGGVNSSVVSAVTDAMEQLLATLSAEGTLACVHHSDGAAGTPITDITCGAVIGTQRRRLR